MAKILDFTGPKAAKRFEFCLEAMLIAGDGKAERNKELIKKEAKIFDLLDEISDPRIEGHPRVLKPEGGCIMIDNDLLALLLQNVENASWKPLAAQGAVDCMQFLENAEVAKLERIR